MKRIIQIQTHVFKNEDSNFSGDFVTIIYALDEDGQIFEKRLGKSYRDNTWSRIDDKVNKMSYAEKRLSKEKDNKVKSK